MGIALLKAFGDAKIVARDFHNLGRLKCDHKQNKTKQIPILIYKHGHEKEHVNLPFISMEVGSKRSDAVRLGKDRFIFNIQINITFLLYRSRKIFF
jgi:hypothetical protein